MRSSKFWLDPVSLADVEGYNSREIARIRRLVEGTGPSSGSDGVTSSAASQVRATRVKVSRSYLDVALSDGRSVRAPISWYPRLAAGSDEQRQRWRLVGRGIGIRWDELDEDLSVEGLLRV